MADVKIVDIDNEQWNMKDQNARDRLTAIEDKLYKRRDFTFGGTVSLSVKGFLIGEDDANRYYQCFIPKQNKNISSPMPSFLLIPQDTNKQEILSLNLNLLQSGNSGIIQKTQHATGTNNSGIVTYLSGQSSTSEWQIKGSLMLREAK